MSVKPFKWTSLKKISPEEIRLSEIFLGLIPGSKARKDLSLNIRKMLLKHLGEKSFYYLDNVSADSCSGFLSSLPESALTVVIGMEPSPSKIIAYIDNNLAFLLIDRLLGGTSETSVETGPLSETEAGVLQYFIMQILAEVWKAGGRNNTYHFRFERFCFEIKGLDKQIPLKESVVIASFKVGIGELAGFIKLVFPKTFVEKAAAVLSSSAKDSSEVVLSNMGRYDFVKTIIWADIGRASISSAELIMLESGDVILFDESGIRLKNNEISGEVDLRVGTGESGSLRAEISPEGRLLHCKVIGT